MPTISASSFHSLYAYQINTRSWSRFLGRAWSAWGRYASHIFDWRRMLRIYSGYTQLSQFSCGIRHLIWQGSRRFTRLVRVWCVVSATSNIQSSSNREGTLGGTSACNRRIFEAPVCKIESSFTKCWTNFLEFQLCVLALYLLDIFHRE